MSHTAEHTERGDICLNCVNDLKDEKTALQVQVDRLTQAREGYAGALDRLQTRFNEVWVERAEDRAKLEAARITDYLRVPQRLCLHQPKKGSGAYGHWCCEQPEHHLSRCRYVNYTWWRIPIYAWRTVKYAPKEPAGAILGGSD